MSPKSKRNNNRKVAAPVATAVEARTRGPRIVYTRGGGQRIRHSELIDTISGSVAFTIAKAIPLNPGLLESFPWLATIAQLYEQFQVHDLSYELLTRTATSTVGSVLLAPEYNAGHAPPASEAQMSAYEGCVEDVPWRDIRCRLSNASMHALGPRKFIRQGNVAGDLKTYDVGTMYVATVEEVGTNAIGKLWVHYDIELFVPQIEGSAPMSSKASSWNLGADETLTTATPAVLFAGGSAEEIANPLGIVEALGVFTLAHGAYLMMVDIGLRDSANEAFELAAVVLQDGAAMTQPLMVNCNFGAVGAARIGAVSMSGIVFSDGDTNFRVQVTATGAAGTLALQDDDCRVTFLSV